ncbi:anhydro-N-acetylmuramic acid kinase [Lewinella sp. LCG006]|uniref:anhydro-N-acetylmuramic acid kinase n=1 Tax=Lewinella sp. LCG006 TaxID=3231911 RepID=UPI0034602F1B
MSTFSVVGLMSGSSLDGADLAWCTFQFAADDPAKLLSWTLHRGITIPYDESWQQRLRNAPLLGGRELWLLHTELGLHYGRMLRTFIDELPERVDFVASHGHTVFHYPEQHTTTQIGDGAAIAGILNIPVIDQFRAQDMALGGQGAPLAPLADRYFFPQYFACLNLGGISNISIKTDHGYVAFDVGGANQVLDTLMQEIGKDYDKNGDLARTGQLIPKLKAAADALPFHTQPPPKSLGNDWVREQLLPLFQDPQYALADRLHTYCHHMAGQIGASLRKVAEKENIELTDQQQLLVAGGGGFNAFLCECIAAAVQPVQLEIAAADIIAFKEAALMALAGALRWQRQPNVIPSVTGARRAAVGGAIHWA